MEQDADRRADLINRTIGISHLRQIETVREELRAWLQTHPDDAGIRDLDAQLARQEAEASRQSAGTFAYLTTSRYNVVRPGQTQGKRPTPREA
jgi:hypothetical protein